MSVRDYRGEDGDAVLRAGDGDVEKRRVAAVGSVVGAILASACCVVPLVLVTLGIGGAWIGSLTALEPYKPYTIAATLVFLAFGFRHVYARPKTVCVEGTYCARPAAGRITKTVLWAALVVVVLSATINLWAPLFY